MITIEEISEALPVGITVSGLLERGGQGSVFDGVCNGYKAAIKLISPHTTEPKRVYREVQFLKENAHPNIVKVLHNCSIKLRGLEIPLVAYEFIDGGNLSQLMIRAPALPTEIEILKFGKQMANAVDGIWHAKARVVHRDIKPLNIMQRTNGDFVLVDFGFAKHVDLSNMTALGTNPGTLGHMSPEQAMGRTHLTNKSDIFSLGVTMFLYATKKHPFGGLQPRPGIAISEDINVLRSDLSVSLRDTILSMLSISASDRPGNLVAQFETMGGN